MQQLFIKSLLQKRRYLFFFGFVFWKVLERGIFLTFGLLFVLFPSTTFLFFKKKVKELTWAFERKKRNYVLPIARIPPTGGQISSQNAK